jgi:hypothetical protein
MTMTSSVGTDTTTINSTAEALAANVARNLYALHAAVDITLREARECLDRLLLSMGSAAVAAQAMQLSQSVQSGTWTPSSSSSSAAGAAGAAAGGGGGKRRLVLDASTQAELCRVCAQLLAVDESVLISDRYVYSACLTLLTHAAQAGFGQDEGEEEEEKKKEGEGEEEEEFCWCLRGEGPHVGHMIACDTCEKWFHVDCVTRGLSRKVVAKLDSFVCVACETAVGRRYKFAW